MDMESYVARYFENVRIATRDDNERILEFYRKLSMLGGAFNIQFVKDPDYFRFMDWEGKTHYVLVMEDENKRLEGMAALAVRPCYVDGKIERVAHVSDLRFLRRRDRKTKIDWKDLALEFVSSGHEIKELEGCRIFLGSFVMANDFARKAFTSQKTPFDISNVASYQMVNLVGRKPLKWAGLRGSAQAKSVNVSRGSEADRDALRTFLDNESKRRTLGFVYAGPDGELDRRLAAWDGFSMKDFFIARDPSNTIIGCFAPWDLSAGRRIIVDNFPAGLGVAANVAKRLGRNVPTPGNPLEVLYLTTLELAHTLDKEARGTVFGAMLDALYESGVVKQYHMVAYCDYDNESLLHAVEPAYFTQKTPTLLYQMHEKGASDGVVREKELTCHAGHEMCLT
jgi:hypothetical protein